MDSRAIQLSFSGPEAHSIVDVIGRYIRLRQSGKEYFGLCPFHADQNPSLAVNKEKGLYHCFGCGEAGDAIRFVMTINKVSFKEALKILGVERKPSARMRSSSTKTSKAAVVLTRWVVDFSLRLSDALIAIGQRKLLACELHWAEEQNRLYREWAILSLFHQDIFDPRFTKEIYDRQTDLGAIINAII